jgi:hypothetical protein
MTIPSWPLRSGEVLIFYYFVQFLISFYSPGSIFRGWAKFFFSQNFPFKTISLLVIVSFNIHISHAYVTTGLITEKCNFSFAFFLHKLALKYLFICKEGFIS